MTSLQTDGRINGVMLDLARCLERKRYYEELIPHLADWGYNTLFLHFADDQGCMYKFESAPGIGSPHGFNRREMQRLIATAGKYGLDVVPELECLGHIRYVTEVPRFRRLFHAVHGAGEVHFDSICPAREESLAVVEKLIRETANVFPSPYLHAGLDEVNLAKNCPSCRRRFGRKSDNDIYVWWVNQIHGRIASTGKTMMMWGDHLAKSPEMLDRVSRGIVVCHWDYGPKVNWWCKEGVDKYLSTLSAKGFKVVLCPAMFCWGEGILPGRERFINTARSAALAARHRQKGEHILGLMNTVWTGWRFDAHAMTFAMASAANAFHRGGAIAPGFPAEFCRRYFGMQRQDTAKRVGEALPRIHNLPPLNKLEHFALPAGREVSGFPATWPIDRKIIASAKRILQQIKPEGVVLRCGARSVTRNRRDFQALTDSFDMVVFLCEQVLALHALGVGIEEAAADTCKRARVEDMAREVRRMQRKWDSIWTKNRYPDDPVRNPTNPRHWSGDNIYWRLSLCADHLEKLTRAAG